MYNLYTKHILILLSILIPFITYISNSHAYNPKYASIVIDLETNTILHQSNSNKALHPASLTKMMTLLMVFDALEKGKIRLYDRIYVSNHAASMPPSKAYIKAGSSIKIIEAINLLVTKSANDVAVAIAEKLGGNEAAFARIMTRKAKQIGMSRTKFINASGLHNKRQISTARDMAKLSRYIFKRYPQYYHYFSTRYYEYKGKKYKNHNNLLRKYRGVDGIKTGYVRASGFNLAVAVERDGRRIIAVVFGGKTAKSRDRHMVKLLDKSYEKLERLGLLNKTPPKPHKKSMDNLLVASAKISNSFPGIGEGDFDPSQIISTQKNLISLLNHTKAQKEMALARQSGLKLQRLHWSIQVGAFKTRAQTQKAISRAITTLPDSMANMRQSIYPMRKSSGSWLFQARLSGFTQKEAIMACNYLKDCFVIKQRKIR